MAHDFSPDYARRLKYKSEIIAAEKASRVRIWRSGSIQSGMVNEVYHNVMMRSCLKKERGGVHTKEAVLHARKDVNARQEHLRGVLDCCHSRYWTLCPFIVRQRFIV